MVEFQKISDFCLNSVRKLLKGLSFLFQFVEYRDRLVKAADTLLDLAMPCYAQGKA